MNVEAGRAVPAWSAVAVEQFRRIGVGLRVLGLGIAVLLLLVGAWTLYSYYSAGKAMDWRVTLFLLAILTAFISARTWFQNEVERRSYMWALPVERGKSHLSMVAAGWLWLMLVVSVYMSWCVALYTLTGRTVRGGLPMDIWPPPNELMGYVVPYISASIIYLIASVPLILARRPIMWVIWGYLGIYFPMQFLGGADSPLVRFVIEEVFGRGRLGLLTAITGKWNVDLPVLTFDPGAWLTAAGFWLTITLSAVACAAAIHREA